MNEIIKHCWLTAAREDSGDSWDSQEQFIERFAKVIVRKCLSLSNDLSKHYINTHPEQEQAWLLASIADYSNEIKKCFEIEE